MNENALNQSRMEDLKILLYEVVTQKHAEGKLTLLMDISQRIPKELTVDEFETVVNELAKSGYADFEPGPGVRARFKPSVQEVSGIIFNVHTCSRGESILSYRVISY